MSTPDRDSKHITLATGAVLVVSALCCGLPLLIAGGALAGLGTVLGKSVGDLRGRRAPCRGRGLANSSPCSCRTLRGFCLLCAGSTGRRLIVRPCRRTYRVDIKSNGLSSRIPLQGKCLTLTPGADPSLAL